MERISKENYYLNIAQTVLERATCLRRVYGAIIVKNDEIISTDATSCAMCRRLVIHAGLSKVVIRNTETEYSVVDVQDWVDLEDDVPDLR